MGKLKIVSISQAADSKAAIAFKIRHYSRPQRHLHLGSCPEGGNPFRSDRHSQVRGRGHVCMSERHGAPDSIPFTRADSFVLPFVFSLRMKETATVERAPPPPLPPSLH